MKFRLSLQFKLIAAVTTVIVIALSVFYFVSISNQKKIFNDSFHDSAISLAQALDSEISSKADLLDVEKLQSNIYKLLWLNSNIIGISIDLPVGMNLVTVASNDTNSIGQAGTSEGLSSFNDGTIILNQVTESNGVNILRVITPVHVGGKRVGIYTIRLSLDTLTKAIAATQIEFLLITILSILIIIISLSVYLKVTVIDSIKDLSHGMEKIGTGKLDYRMKIGRRDEIGDLFSGLNSMAERLNERTNELSHSKEHIEIIVDNLADGLIEYTRAGVVLRINHTAERLLGITREDVVNLKISRDQEKDSHLATLANIIFPEKEALVREIEITSPLPTSLQIVTVSLPETIDTGYVSILRDITREKLIDQEKTSFISVAAHQMRTPLSATKWIFSTMHDDYGKELSDEINKLVDMGIITNNHMVDIVNDLLTVSRIEEGRYGYNFVENDLNEFLKKIIIEYEPVILKKSLKLSLNSSQDSLSFPFDAPKLSIAIHGLIDNAINYTKEKGSITVTLGKEGGNAVISVADTGIGIPTEEVNKLFTKFYRAKNAILASPNGSGLGLFIVKNIVTEHEGTVSVTHNTPVGTIFTIRLPLSH